MSNSVQPHRRQPNGLPGSWDSPGKNTGVGCHFLLQCMKVKMKVKSLSRIRLLATPWTAAYQAPPSVGFSRQEYWSGVPLPSPVWYIGIVYLKRKLTAAGNIIFEKCFKNSTKANLQQKKTKTKTKLFKIFLKWIKC